MGTPTVALVGILAACRTTPVSQAQSLALTRDPTCVQGSYPDCTGSHLSWTGSECCIDVPVTCVAGSYPDCTDSRQYWTGAVCCVATPITCVAGSYPDCTDSKQHWTGALCCIEGAVRCDDRARLDCFDTGDHYTGTQCCTEAGPVEVSAAGGRFAPPNVTVAQGQTVRWVNTDTEMHTVTSGASSDPSSFPGSLFDMDLAPGEAFAYAFDAPGTYPYFCRIHEQGGMRGVVTVLP
jgi:plastocyanin